MRNNSIIRNNSIRLFFTNTNLSKIYCELVDKNRTIKNVKECLICIKIKSLQEFYNF